MDATNPETEFAELLQKIQGRLYGFIHSLVRDFDDADDLFQQTTVILWNKFPQYDRQKSFFAWACGIARFEVANFLRSRSRKKLYFSDDLNLLLVESFETQRSEDGEERSEALRGCLEKLRQRDRELLLSCYGSEEKITAIAERNGRSSQSVHNTLKRLRLALFDCVERTLRLIQHRNS